MYMLFDNVFTTAAVYLVLLRGPGVRLLSRRGTKSAEQSYGTIKVAFGIVYAYVRFMIWIVDHTYTYKIPV